MRPPRYQSSTPRCLAPQAGFEPARTRLTAVRSTTELLGNEWRLHQRCALCSWESPSPLPCLPQGRRYHTSGLTARRQGTTQKCISKLEPKEGLSPPTSELVLSALMSELHSAWWLGYQQVPHSFTCCCYLHQGNIPAVDSYPSYGSWMVDLQYN